MKMNFLDIKMIPHNVVVVPVLYSSSVFWCYDCLLEVCYGASSVYYAGAPP